MYYENRYKFLYDLRIGDSLILKRESDNVYDPNAIEVYNKHNNKIGYIERQYANYIASYLDRGYKYECVINDIIYPDPPVSYGKMRVKIELKR